MGEPEDDKGVAFAWLSTGDEEAIESMSVVGRGADNPVRLGPKEVAAGEEEGRRRKRGRKGL